MPELHVRDPDDSVHSRVVDYARRNGRTVSEAVRELLARGLEATSGQAIDAAALAQQLHARIAALDQRIPATKEYHRRMMMTMMENIMLTRQIAALMKPEIVQKAQQNARSAFEQLSREGEV